MAQSRYARLVLLGLWLGIAVVFQGCDDEEEKKPTPAPEEDDDEEDEDDDDETEYPEPAAATPTPHNPHQMYDHADETLDHVRVTSENGGPLDIAVDNNRASFTGHKIEQLRQALWWVVMVDEKFGEQDFRVPSEI